MNIFIMFLMAALLGVYYMLGSPSVRVLRTETEYAVAQSDLRAVAECATAAHNAAIRGIEFNDICAEQNGIVSEKVCFNEKNASTSCEIVRNKKPAHSYIITATAALPAEKYNDMLEILESNYADAGAFGLLNEGVLITGDGGKRTILDAAVKKLKLADGQLVYVTQFDIPDAATTFSTPDTADIICPAGMIKVYRFSRWQCVAFNTKENCVGDRIWDSDLAECVPDESRKPLCAAQQTAVMVDDIWQCLDPFPENACPAGMVARLNYGTLEWECVADPAATPDTKKCAHITPITMSGTFGITLRAPDTSCTDCERMVTNMDTCTSYCVPDASKINDPKCYPAGANSCRGASRAFYFGFPNYSYANNVPDISSRIIPLDRTHSQNRKFNCLECGERGINESKSFPPYIAVCNE